ncbi:MAG: hypothetical protein V5A33_03120 [Halobacteriales archaeon]
MNGDDPGGTGEVPDGESDGPHPDSGDTAAVTRRRLVASGAATWATVSLAGCNYITDPYSPEEDSEPTTTVTTQTSTTDSPGTPGGTTDGAPSGTESTPTETTTAPPTTTTACANIDRFAPGMDVGIHVGVYDSQTGSFLGEEAIDSVTIEFPEADFGPIDLSWKGPHEKFSTNGWGGKITTSSDTDPGTYRYYVSVEANEASEVADETVTDQFRIV